MLQKLSAAIKATGLDGKPSDERPQKFHYSRPSFLGLSLDEQEMRSLAAYDVSRPVLTGGDRVLLPWNSGYSETMNSGKTSINEDQGQAVQFFLTQHDEEEVPPEFCDFVYSGFREHEPQPLISGKTTSTLVTYFGLFDCHAGEDAAVFARHLLHKHIRDKLQHVYPLLLEKLLSANDKSESVETGSIFFDDLVIGAIEMAFLSLDDQIGSELSTYKIKGGCTALVVLFLFDKVYIANAGDTRAVLVRKDGGIEQLSNDFSPVYDRERIQAIATQHPELLGGQFCPLQFSKRLSRADIGKRVPCRSGVNKGWFLRTVTDEDLHFPLFFGTERKSRLLATIAVARGFGDHNLRVFDSSIRIKPFLSSVPEVTVIPLEKVTAEDVIIMGTDGLWDVLSLSRAADGVMEVLNSSDTSTKYVLAAQELVVTARGNWIPDEGRWCVAPGVLGSGDDISCFVIPLPSKGSPLI